MVTLMTPKFSCTVFQSFRLRLVLVRRRDVKVRRLVHVHLDGAQVHGAKDCFAVFLREALRQHQVHVDLANHARRAVHLKVHGQVHALCGKAFVFAEAKGIDTGTSRQGAQEQLKRRRRTALTTCPHRLVCFNDVVFKSGVYSESAWEFNIQK